MEKTKRQLSSPEAGPGGKRHCPNSGQADANIDRAKEMMAKVNTQLINQKKNLMNFIDYVSENISKLDNFSKKEGIRKKTTVGVFGKTGAGKSSLINAILGENLLPSGTLCACTSVITQVEANVTDSNYTAEIEFISKEGWKDELKRLLEVTSQDAGRRDTAMYRTAKQKLTALYGKEYKPKTLDDLMKDENFAKIPEFVKSKTKVITSETASDFLDEIRCYVQNNESSPGECYWPVVNSVTIKVPNCKDFLENIVLVDLPGTGDYNKSRDQMWRLKLKDCSTVWIISQADRAVSDNNAWEIVSKSIKDMAQGGECRSMSFICTKTDDINPEEYMRLKKLTDKNLGITAQDPDHRNKRRIACIEHRNNIAKEAVKESFDEQHTIKENFNCDDNFLSVFTVSSKEFTIEDAILRPEQTEIPMLKDLLKKYNNSYINKTTSDYISGAHGILSLIQGSSESDTDMMAKKARLHDDLRKNFDKKHELLRDHCRNLRTCMEELLSKGAKVSEEKCDATATKIIKNYDGRGFHRTLTALCENGGVWTSRNGETRNLNMSLIKPMQDHIDKAFNEYFPDPDKPTGKSLFEKIDMLTIVSKEPNKEFGNSPVLSHLQKFLQSEEEKLKTVLKLELVTRKKEIYDSLLKSVETSMQPGYNAAATITGAGSMTKKQEKLLDYIQSKKSEMFQNAKTEMLDQLYETLNDTMKTIKTELMKSMEYSLCNASTLSNIDVSEEIQEMEKMEKLKRSS